MSTTTPMDSPPWAAMDSRRSSDPSSRAPPIAGRGGLIELTIPVNLILFFFFSLFLFLFIGFSAGNLFQLL